MKEVKPMVKQNWDKYLKAVFGDNLTEKELVKMLVVMNTSAGP